MPFQKEETEETKGRILKVSELLFSEKGFDATRVDQIAQNAGVNKALIYYYFRSKEEILNDLVQSLYKDIEAISLDFAHKHVVQMIKDGLLDIKEDRWSFANNDAIRSFMRNVQKFYRILLDFALEHRRTMRILVFESLKNGRHHNGLFHLLNLLNKDDKNPIFKTIREADPDYTYHDNTVLFKFFFGFLPLISFAAYFDDYKATTALSEKELRNLFLNSYQSTMSSWVSGRDILIWPSV